MAEGELFGATVAGIALFTPTWLVMVGGLRLGLRARAAWMDTRSLPRPALLMVLGAALTVATTAYERLDILDPWRWASLLPAVAAALALLALGSTLLRRWRRRDAARWTPAAGR